MTTLLCTDQLAAWLKVSPETVRRHTRAGDIPFTRAGRAYRFNPDAIRGWLAANTAKHRDDVSGSSDG